MCGIVGFVSSQPVDVVDNIVHPLKQLEYRGYDSCGVAFTVGESVETVKTIGGVDLLREKFTSPAKSSVAIAHTRWATHGSVKLENTHPQVSNDRVFIVHNGVIDNHETLKNKLISQGYVFTSETDTEVIAHLIHAYLKLGYHLTDGVSAALRDLQGKFSFVAIDAQESCIVAAKHGRPLIVYKNSTHTYVASDVSAFEGMEPGEICFVNDGVVIEARPGGLLRFYRDDNEFYQHLEKYQPEKEVTSVKLRTIIEAEIAQQPVAIEQTLSSLNVEEIRKSLSVILEGTVPKICLIGCGTSYHSAQMGAYWLQLMAGIDARAEISSEFANSTTLDPKTGLYVLISQSGETADTLAALDKIEQLSQNQHRTLSVCNVAHSELVRRTHFHLPLKAGVERSVASTKAFTAQLAALLKLSIALANLFQSGAGSIPFITADVDKTLLEIPGQIQATIDAFKPELVEGIDLRAAFFLGRNCYLPIAREGALKLTEIGYVPCLPYAVGELKHGPLALITQGTPVFTCFHGREADLEKLFSSLSQIEARGGVNFLVTDQVGYENAKAHGLNCERWMPLPTLSRYEPYISPVLAVVMLQLISHEIALKVNKDVDKPRNLAKSVTVE
jgi:glucosamine--fructose-6-phosphate aminotransferase (isomerizing)